jgi:hypothetical protein
MRRLFIGLVIAVFAMALVPASASADDFKQYEEKYLKLYECSADKQGERAPGRNIVLWGFNEKRDATEAEVRESIDVLYRQCHPAPVVTEPVTEAPVASETVSEPTTPTTSTGGVGNATVQCESGGDYGANTGNGYYGGYQFDSGTWDAYGDPAYGEANEAPPAVQDAAAASVPYDAWPNC